MKKIRTAIFLALVLCLSACNNLGDAVRDLTTAAIGDALSGEDTQADIPPDALTDETMPAVEAVDGGLAGDDPYENEPEEDEPEEDERDFSYAYHPVTKEDSIEFVNNSAERVGLQTTNNNRYEYVMYDPQGNQSSANASTSGTVYLEPAYRFVTTALDDARPVEFFFPVEYDITVNDLSGAVSEYHRLTQMKSLEFSNNSSKSVWLRTTNNNRYMYVVYNQQGRQMSARSSSANALHLIAGNRVIVSPLDENRPVEFYFKEEHNISVREINEPAAVFHMVARMFSLEFINNTSDTVWLRTTNNNRYEYAIYNRQGRQTTVRHSFTGNLHLPAGSRAVVTALDESMPVVFYYGAETNIAANGVDGPAIVFQTVTASGLEIRNGSSATVWLRTTDNHPYEQATYNRQGRQTMARNSATGNLNLPAGSRAIIAALDEARPVEFYFGTDSNISVAEASVPVNIYHTVTTGGLEFTNSTSGSLILRTTSDARYKFTSFNRQGRQASTSESSSGNLSIPAGGSAVVAALDASSPVVFYYGAESDVTVD
jgi:hypothetical protein